MPEYTLFDARVTLLTPLHIGTGRDLLLDYDYAVRGGRTWRINEDALLDAQDVEDLAMADALARTPPAQLLRESDFQIDSPLFDYVLQGIPRSRQAGAQLREQIKNVWRQPYLPGSSLKGALRTALAWHGFAALHMRPDVGKLNRNRKWAAQGIERDILGRSPNYDLLRALHVGDSDPVGSDRLMLANAQVLTRGGASAPIELEAVRPETVFRLTVKLDEGLFSDWARELGLGSRAEWLRGLPTVVRAHVEERIQTERAWYAGVQEAQEAQTFYGELASLGLPENAFVLQLGWGGGWDSKTLGSRLRADERFMENVIDKYKLARGRRRPGDAFPKSRRILVRVRQTRDGRAIEQPALPLGWAMVEMIRRDEPSPEAAPPREEPVPEVRAERPVTVEGPGVPRAPSAPEPSEAPVAVPKAPAVAPGPHTGVVVRFNLIQKQGTILVDGSELQVEVRLGQLRKGVRYLVAGARVAFTLVQDDQGIHPEDVRRV
ncbi:MAG: type III-A CRISPR-associated RAMP protein Csm5 [Anaerolineae bacterium]|nr:type III-A CRISPR-associated RAMP protein Csm5 [Anaerolineae bacterium]